MIKYYVRLRLFQGQFWYLCPSGDCFDCSYSFNLYSWALTWQSPTDYCWPGRQAFKWLYFYWRWFVLPVRIHRKVHGAVLTLSQIDTWIDYCFPLWRVWSGFRGKRSTTILKDVSRALVSIFSPFLCIGPNFFTTMVYWQMTDNGNSWRHITIQNQGLVYASWWKLQVLNASTSSRPTWPITMVPSLTKKETV